NGVKIMHSTATSGAAAVNEVRNSAGHIFDDMFKKGQSVFSSLNNLLKGGALSIGRTIFQDVSGALLRPIYSAFQNFFNKTLKGLIDGLLGSIGSKIGGFLGNLVGLGSTSGGSSILGIGAGGLGLLGGIGGGAGIAGGTTAAVGSLAGIGGAGGAL